MYQPQVASWVDQKHMTLYAALSYLAAGAQKPALGTVKVETETKVAVDDRLVSFSDFKITEANFPTVPKESLMAMAMDIVNAIPLEQRVIALDRVLAMVDTSQITPKNSDGVKADPPPIFFSQVPAVLVNVEGDPMWSPIPENELQFALNTNWDLFQLGNSYYLRDDQSWLTAVAIRGPWKRAGALPPSFSTLPANDDWTAARAAVPGKAFPSGELPHVFVSTRPAELILLDGAPKYVPVKGTSLMWVSNTESDVFRAGADGAVFFLVSGRWFSAPNFEGPWTFVTPELPGDFKRIPLDHPRSRVLASVPGTRQALEGVLLAQVSQTARVNRSQITAPEVGYKGDPQFEAIEQTQVARAVNTDQQILRVGDLYYMCFQGVWFVGGTPTGPWKVADSIPNEIYEIPISSPAHNVTYVTVDNSDDEWVDFAATAGYAGLMTAWGCAVWGTGWYYPPYVGYGGYFPYYPTYGYGAHYNPWTGTFSRTGGVYGPYGGAGFTARYNPATGTYSRGAMAYGPNGARGVATAFNPRTGISAGTARGSNVYGNWSSTAVQRGDQWAQSSKFTRNATGTTTRATQGSRGGAAVTRRGPEGGGFAGKTAGGDMYAGRDGNVYRNQGGSWQKYGNGGWSSVERPAGTSGQLGTRSTENFSRGTFDQLNQDRGSRLDGAQRTRDFARSSGGFSGSYRPSGGGMRMGGGGFRGGGRR